MSLKGIKMGRIPNSKKQTYITPDGIITTFHDFLETDQTLSKYTDSEINKNLVVNHLIYLTQSFQMDYS